MKIESSSLGCNSTSMETKAIKDLPRGEYFRLQDSDTAPVWVRGEYIRQEKKYSTHRFDDVNHERLLPGTMQVYVDFTF